MFYLQHIDLTVLNMSFEQKHSRRGKFSDIFNCQVAFEAVEGVFASIGEQLQFQVFHIANAQIELRVQSRIFGQVKVVSCRPRSEGCFLYA